MTRMRDVTKRVCWMLCLCLPVSLQVVAEEKRAAVRGQRQHGESIDTSSTRILKGGKKSETDSEDEAHHVDEDDYDYYYPWDMYKYGPKQRPAVEGDKLSTKGLSGSSPSANTYPANTAPTSTESANGTKATKPPGLIEKKKSSSKSENKKGKGKGGKGIKSKLSRKGSESSSSGGKGRPDSGDVGGGDIDSGDIGGGKSGDNGGGGDNGDSGGGGNNEDGCKSELAATIAKAVPEVVTRNPPSCCGADESQAVYVTHALAQDGTASGFEPFWDEVYTEIASDSFPTGACFVMTGIDSSVSSRTTDEILLATNQFVSKLPKVVSMMSTDPTEDVDLITEIRSISNNILAPSIGVFNAGYDNIIVESILGAQGRLPYIGYLEESSFGAAAAQISIDLLNGVPASPLCFNARIGIVDFVGERCSAYYNEITSQVIEPEIGISCSANSTAAELFFTITAQNANAVLSHVDCCSAVADAVERVRQEEGRTIVVGCTDADTSGGRVDFVTTQPVGLQAYSAASWANFPVIQAQQGRDGRGIEYFPSLRSLVNTDVFNEIIL